MDHGVDTEEDEDQFKVGPQWRSSRLTVYRQGMCCAQLRTQLWRLTEDPDSSRAAKVRSCTVLYYNFTVLYCAKVLVIVSSLFLVTSIIMLILSTVPEFQVCLAIMAAGRQ